MLVAVELTSLARKQLPKSIWRGIHLTSYIAFWLTSLHSTFAGTDKAQPIYLASSTVALVAVMMAVLYRVTIGRRRTSPAAQAPATAASTGAIGA